MNDVTDAISTRLLNEKEASTVLCCSVALLRKWRLYGGGPRYCRLGRLVRYAGADLLEYIEQRRVEAA